MPITSTFGAMAARGFGLFSAIKQAIDEYFEYVTLLLPGNGTNGAQNNTFLDSSTNNFTITRNGNTTQGTFAPYGANWSNYFDGSGDYLTVPHSTVLNLSSGDFTIECWLYTITSGTGIALGKGTGSTYDGYFFYSYAGTNRLDFYASTNGTSWDVTLSATTPAVSRNTWNHIAVTRSGSTFRIFVNGVQAATVSNAGSLLTNSGAFAIGAGNAGGQMFSGGYISNVRVVSGTALYTANFTSSTTPLTAVSGTQLLTCQSNRLIDNSTNNFTITKNGDVSVQVFSPFNPTASYAAGTIGGSGYFDGAGDYLTAPSNTAYTFGTGDFTVEMWVYPQSDANMALIDARSSGTAVPWAVYTTATTRTPYWYDGTSRTSSIALTLNAWNHVAVARASGTLRIFVNGVVGYNAANTTDINSTGTVQIGGAFSGAYYTGYITNLRVLKGTALYTAAFTPPTSPLTAISNTSLLLNFTNAGIIDNAMMNNLETVGDAQISTTQSKWGGSSIAFDGTDDWLYQPNTIQTNLGTGDFTIEGWVRLNATGVGYSILQKQAGGVGGYAINITSANKLRLNMTSGFIDGTTSLSANVWYFFTAVRSGTASGNVKLYLNGILEATSPSAWNDNLSPNLPFYVGAGPYTGAPLNGYIDDLRITKGYARYTANFTPPAGPFPTR